MDENTLSLIAGAVLSLLFSYVPGLSDWFDKLDGVYKRLVMALLLLAVSLGIVGLACAGLAADFGLVTTCDRTGVIAVLQAFLIALAANQTMYAISKKE